ncbi:hypothetical protein [Saliphagus sp. LR7]|uniref:hypothetical protein n=1 Tax=Saliphagus sp. LR7 TaxID=2282654 RepID=UPI000DF72DBD|nr:hypothetical protein [Saliphagus sp. LR7]
MAYVCCGRYRHHALAAGAQTTGVDDPPSDTADDDEPRILMEWSLWDDRDDEQTGRRISAVPHDGQKGAWKAILEVQPHAEFWVERATIGYGESPDNFDVVNPEEKIVG